MNLTRENLIRLVARLRRPAARAAMGSVGNPARDWTALLIGASVLLLVAIGVSALSLISKDRAPASAVQPVSVGSLDREALAAALKRLSERRASFDALKSRPPAIVDPSK